MSLNQKDVLGLEFLSKDEIYEILDLAKSMKEIVLSDVKKAPNLRGKSVITLFYEASTRTRTSFELAGKYLSADTVNIATATSSVVKGESLQDTGKTLEMMGADVIIIRHNMSGAPHILAKSVSSHVINAGDGTHAHPTQGLLDLYSMRERLGHIEGLKVTILGDILHSRVARSNIWGLQKLGATVNVCGPSTLLPVDLEKMGVKVYTDIDEAIYDSDVVNVLRLQLERQENAMFPTISEYHKLYGLTEERLAKTKKDILVLHPGPMNRGVEISSKVADSTRAVINEQVTNGLAVRMALLQLLAGGDN